MESQSWTIERSLGRKMLLHSNRTRRRSGEDEKGDRGALKCHAGARIAVKRGGTPKDWGKTLLEPNFISSLPFCDFPSFYSLLSFSFLAFLPPFPVDLHFLCRLFTFLVYFCLPNPLSLFSFKFFHSFWSLLLCRFEGWDAASLSK